MSGRGEGRGYAARGERGFGVLKCGRARVQASGQVHAAQVSVRCKGAPVPSRARRSTARRNQPAQLQCTQPAGQPAAGGRPPPSTSATCQRRLGLAHQARCSWRLACVPGAAAALPAAQRPCPGGAAPSALPPCGSSPPAARLEVPGSEQLYGIGVSQAAPSLTLQHVLHMQPAASFPVVAWDQQPASDQSLLPLRPMLAAPPSSTGRGEPASEDAEDAAGHGRVRGRCAGALVLPGAAAVWRPVVAGQQLRAGRSLLTACPARPLLAQAGARGGGSRCLPHRCCSSGAGLPSGTRAARGTRGTLYCNAPRTRATCARTRRATAAPRPGPHQNTTPPRWPAPRARPARIRHLSQHSCSRRQRPPRFSALLHRAQRLGPHARLALCQTAIPSTFPSLHLHPL